MLLERQQLHVTMDRRDSLFRGVVGVPGHASAIFMSTRISSYLRHVDIVFCDGTFASRPSRPRTSQVFQISTTIRNHVIPLAQVLMESRTIVAYEAVLRALKFFCLWFRPRLVIADFEAAPISAWRNVFGCSVQGCFWHYTRAVTIMARSLGLTFLMNGNPSLQSIVRSTTALPLLPQEAIADGLLSLMIEATRFNLYHYLHGFFQYVFDTWISSFRFQTLSVFMSPHRTNNISESANRMLRLRTLVHHPNIGLFIDAARSMEMNSVLDILSLEEGRDPGRSRRGSAISNDAYIHNYTDDLMSGRISINRFLHLASTRMYDVFNQFLD